MLTNAFFNRDACKVAQDLLGKIIYVRYQKLWLTGQIIETEAYYHHEKASHSSLGYSEKRKALFMSPGTIYMYYARGGDSLNISCRGEGNAVLIKSAVAIGNENVIKMMQQLNPINGRPRPILKICSGQTLLCRALNLKVKHWNQKQFDHEKFYIGDNSYTPKQIIQTTRLGIPPNRDAHLPYRFIDYHYAPYCTRNPLRQKIKNYTILNSRMITVA